MTETNAEQLQGDFDAVAEALRTLGSCWVHDRVPTTVEGIKLTAKAQVSLARLAVAAGLRPGMVRRPA